MTKTNHLGALAAASGTLVVVGLVVLIMVVVEASPAEATFPANPGKIAYSAHHGQDFEIYTINPGGELDSTSQTTLRLTTRLPTRLVVRR
jgi:hypothetical protein